MRRCMFASVRVYTNFVLVHVFSCACVRVCVYVPEYYLLQPILHSLTFLNIHSSTPGNHRKHLSNFWASPAISYTRAANLLRAMANAILLDLINISKSKLKYHSLKKEQKANIKNVLITRLRSLSNFPSHSYRVTFIKRHWCVCEVFSISRNFSMRQN